MTYSLSDQKIFNFSSKLDTLTIEIPIKIPLPNHFLILQLFAQLVNSHKVPTFVQDELRKALLLFVEKETEKWTDEQGDIAVSLLLEEKDCDDDCLWAATFSHQHKPYSSAYPSSLDDSFSAVFRYVLHNSPSDVVAKVLVLEKEHAVQLQTLIRARNWELDRLKREHSVVVEKAIREMDAEDDGKMLNLSASRHFESIQTVESNYASQIGPMMNSQQREYRLLVVQMHQDQALRSKQQQSKWDPEMDALKKETVDENVVDVSQPHGMDESFTIYLGAQLKSMHNLRLLAVDSVKKLCRIRPKSSYESGRRLQMAFGLYGSQLSALVLLVDSRPSFHVNFRTDFAMCCEQSTEYHFQPLETQLHQVSNTVQSSSGLHSGDVYLSRHSNLGHVHVAFHLVADEQLRSTHDVNSRHPCVNGLRNIVRLCAKFGITTITIPLLLVDKLTQEMTVDWCLHRAELVFKCVKGFLMEAYSVGNGFDHGQRAHFNIQFALPVEIDVDLYDKIAQLVPNIFHLVSAVVAE